MIVIAEPYVRFAPTLERSELEIAARAALASCEKVVQAQYVERYEAFHFRVFVRVELGSTRTWVTITSLAGILIYYGNIRQSIDYLVKDARRVAQVAVPSLSQPLRLPGRSPDYQQRRLGVPGQLGRLFRQVERGELSAEEATGRALDLIYRRGPEVEREIPDLPERLAVEFGATPSRHRRREVPNRPEHVPPALPPADLPRRRRIGIVAVRDEDTGEARIETY